SRPRAPRAPLPRAAPARQGAPTTARQAAPARPAPRPSHGRAALELQHQVVLQHLRPELAGALLDLQHGRLDLAGLEVRDVDLRGPLELLELVGQRRGATVAGGFGQLAFLVRERGLDDQEPQVLDAFHLAPERVVRAGVAGEDEAGRTAVE